MTDILTHLANSLGTTIDAPDFWLPLVCYGLLLLTILGSVLLEGFDIGLGFLSFFFGHKRIMPLLYRWREINQFWLLFTLVLFICAFPKAWTYLAHMLYFPLTCIAIGSLCRIIGYELWLRADQASTHHFANLFRIGSVCTIFGYGWTLGQFCVSFQEELPYQIYAFMIALASFIVYALVGACWLAMRLRDDLQRQAITLAKYLVRFAALAIILDLAGLVLSNPGILNKWIAYTRLINFIYYWVIILIGFIVLEILIKRCLHYVHQADKRKHAILYSLPFATCLLLTVIILPGFAYSYFPFFVYGELSIWESISSIDTLSILWHSSLICLPIFALFVLYLYWGLWGENKQNQ